MSPGPRIGTTFAGYRVEGLLGHGGMGVVYRAEHPRLGASVALKVMDPELATDEVFRERFLREARAAARIGHPNIIPIYDAGEWDGDLYMAMRLIEGEDLKSVLRKEGPLSVEQTHEIGIQVASALDAAHRSGLIHRDVKPGNILIETGGDPGSGFTAYVADLGLTKHLESRVGLTQSGQMVGTIYYAAPEQITNGVVDGRADIYSLACVLFECLTGSPPYVRDNQAAVIWAHLHDEVPRATSTKPSLPRCVDHALAKGMAKSPDERFTTARELVDALRSSPEDVTEAGGRNGTQARAMLSSQPPPGPASTTRKARPRRALALVGALGLLFGAGAAAAITVLVGDNGPTATTTASESRSLAATTTATKTAAFTPFDEELMQYVPDDLRASCRHARPITTDFDATVSCHPGGAVASVSYSHAHSGVALFDYFRSGMSKLGLPEEFSGTGLCSTGDIPSVHPTALAGLSGRAEVPGLPQEERLGLIRCWRKGERFRIEWTTREVGVYAAATGHNLGALYDWWRRRAGPEP
jgi:serine/threonine protein kinase